MGGLCCRPLCNYIVTSCLRPLCRCNSGPMKDKVQDFYVILPTGEFMKVFQIFVLFYGPLACPGSPPFNVCTHCNCNSGLIDGKVHDSYIRFSRTFTCYFTQRGVHKSFSNLCFILWSICLPGFSTI